MNTYRGGGVLPIVGFSGWLRLKRVPFLNLAVYKRVGNNCHLSVRKGHKISCKVVEMVVKAKYIKGCHSLAEMTTQMNQND